MLLATLSPDKDLTKLYAQKAVIKQTIFKIEPIA